MVDVMGCFALYVGVEHALHVEIMASINAIEITHDKGWKKLWLECDSLLVAQTFKTVVIVSKQLRNRWLNMVQLTVFMSFLLTFHKASNNSWFLLVGFYPLHHYSFFLKMIGKVV